MLYRFVWVLANILVRVLFNLQVYGKNNLYKIKGGILAVNHSSFLDPIIAGVAISRPIYYLARKDLFCNKLFGWFLRNINVIPFNRNAPDTLALKSVIQLLQKGEIVLVFPEGTRSPDGNLLPPHHGIGFIALKANVPIVPAYIKGSYKILPRHRKFIRIAKAKINIGEPIYIDKWLQKSRIERIDYEEVSGLVMQRIRDLTHA